MRILDYTLTILSQSFFYIPVLSSFLFPAEKSDKDLEWTGLKFSPDGKTILISTNGSHIRLIDAFNGNTMQTFTGHLNSKNLPLEASFSPGKTLFFIILYLLFNTIIICSI